MTTTIKIALVIAVAIALVAIISLNIVPKHKENRQILVANTEPKFDNIPVFIQKSFPNTDFSKASPAIEKILSGGPPKDGIPAIDNPKFTPLSEFKRSGDIEAIVIQDNEATKVYPYNILTWHEIVNDEVDGVPLAITFCPLCGSAIVYDRRSAGESTFGVSGALIESNMVMYDRDTETLWQQSTGEALAGELFGSKLELYPFQLLTIAAVRERYPDAIILSERTGNLRDYGRNPYAGYNENDNQFVFSLGKFDDRFPAKEIMVVFRIGDEVVAAPWNRLADGERKEATVNETTLSLKKSDGELTIIDESGNTYPFFFEMWFSYTLQNPEGIVLDI